MIFAWGNKRKVDTTQALKHFFLSLEGQYTQSNENYKEFESDWETPPAVPCTQTLSLCLSRVFKPFSWASCHLSRVPVDRSSRKKVHLPTFSQAWAGQQVLCKSHGKELTSIICASLMLLSHVTSTLMETSGEKKITQWLKMSIGF